MKKSHFKATKLKCLVIATLATLNTAHAETENKTENSEAVKLDTLNIWATEVKASSISMGEDTFALKQADHISDLLRTIPGVDVGGAHSLNQRITIRSMDDKDLRITIDGANQNTYMYHHMGNLQIHADILKAVDIEVGNNSVVNGGLGGAVRFETKDAKHLLRPGEQYGGRVQLSYSDNASDSIALSGYGQLTDNFDFLAYFNHVNRDNYEVGGGKILDKDGNEIANTNGEVNGLEGELDDALLKFGWDIGDNQRIELAYESYKDEGDYSYRPDMGLATDIAIADFFGLPLTYPTEFTRDTLTLNYELDWGNQNSLKATVFNNESNLTRDESALMSGTISGIATNSGLNLLANSKFTGGINQTLTYGLEYINYDTEYQSDTASSEEDATSSAFFIEDRIQATNKLAVIPGIRYDNYELNSKVVDDTFSQASGALALEYQASNSILLKASSTQLFKAPEIGEVFIGAGLRDTANAGIKEESGTNTEIAIAYESAAAGSDRFTSGLTLFQTDIDDYIYDYATVPGSAPADRLSWKDNIGNMNIQGFEAYLGYQQGSLNALLTLSKAESELDAFADYSSLDNARLDRQQGDTISLNVDYKLPKSDIVLHWDILAADDIGIDTDLDSITSVDNSKKSYVVNNISTSWTPKSVKGLTISFGIDNLFDEYYASQSSRNGSTFHPLFGDLYLLDYEPGRNIKMTASYQF